MTVSVWRLRSPLNFRGKQQIQSELGFSGAQSSSFHPTVNTFTTEFRDMMNFLKNTFAWGFTVPSPQG